MNVAQDVLSVLLAARFDGPSLLLQGDLDRSLYTSVAKVIEAAGGRWNKKAKAHLFEGPAQDAIEPVLLTGTVTSAKRAFGAFFTPPAIAEIVIARAGLEAGMLVLEPSAGRGALAAPALLAGCRVVCVEIDKRNADILCSTGFAGVVQADFLEQPAWENFDRVVMNPPFANRADIHHVSHAVRFLKPAGCLVAIMSAGVMFRMDLLAANFRQSVASWGGSIEPLPDEAFKESGTSVRTCLVTIEKRSAV